MLNISNKQKIVAGVGLLILFVPIYLLSPKNLDASAKFWFDAANRTKPEAPNKVWWAGRTYEVSQRPEKAYPIWVQFLNNFGGNWEKIEMDGQFGYLPWEDPTKRPKPVSDRPNSLAPFVALKIAEKFEKDRDYTKSKYLFSLVLRHFADNAEAKTAAEKGLMRDKQRTF